MVETMGSGREDGGLCSDGTVQVPNCLRFVFCQQRFRVVRWLLPLGALVSAVGLGMASGVLTGSLGGSSSALVLLSLSLGLASYFVAWLGDQVVFSGVCSRCGCRGTAWSEVWFWLQSLEGVLPWIVGACVSLGVGRAVLPPDAQSRVVLEMCMMATAVVAALFGLRTLLIKFCLGSSLRSAAVERMKTLVLVHRSLRRLSAPLPRWAFTQAEWFGRERAESASSATEGSVRLDLGADDAAADDDDQDLADPSSLPASTPVEPPSELDVLSDMMSTVQTHPFSLWFPLPSHHSPSHSPSSDSPHPEPPPMTPFLLPPGLDRSSLLRWHKRDPTFALFPVYSSQAVEEVAKSAFRRLSKLPPHLWLQFLCEAEQKQSAAVLRALRMAGKHAARGEGRGGGAGGGGAGEGESGGGFRESVGVEEGGGGGWGGAEGGEEGGGEGKGWVRGRKPLEERVMALASYFRALPEVPSDLTTQVTIGHLTAILRNGTAVATVLKSMDTNEDGLVSESEWTNAYVSAYRDWRDARATLKGLEGASAAVHWFGNVLFGLLSIVAILLCFRVNLEGILIPMASIILSLSFALGTPISQAVQSMVFVLVQRSFSVGDRVTLSGYKDATETVYVREIGAFQSSFVSVFGTRIFIPNHLLADMVVQNQRRSDNASLMIPLVVSARASSAQIGALKDLIEEWILEHQKEWKPNVTLNIADFEANAQATLRLNLWVSSRFTLQESAKVFKNRSKLLAAVMQFLRDLKITFISPPLPITIQSYTALTPSHPAIHDAAHHRDEMHAERPRAPLE